MASPTRSPTPSSPDTAAVVLSVRRLQVHYPLIPAWPWQAGGIVRAVNDVQFDLRPGEMVGVVGGPGCGKSTLARAIAGRQPATSGSVVVAGQALKGLGEKGWERLQRDLGVVAAQAPGVSSKTDLATVLTGRLAGERPDLDAGERSRRIDSLLAKFGLEAVAGRPSKDLDAAQAVAAAVVTAVAPGPRVLVWDLGADSQAAGALAALRRQQRDDEMAVAVFCRDPRIVREQCDRVVVMFMGRLMEQAPRDEWYSRPRHPYSRVLLAGGDDVPGQEINPADPPSGCVFRIRCEMADSLCGREVPHLRKAGASHAACHFVADAEMAPAS